MYNNRHFKIAIFGTAISSSIKHVSLIVTSVRQLDILSNKSSNKKHLSFQTALYITSCAALFCYICLHYDFMTSSIRVGAYIRV